MFLKPCPLCGCPEVWTYNDVKDAYIECAGCHFVLSGDDPEGLAEEWNLRSHGG